MNEEQKKTLAWAIYRLALLEDSKKISKGDFQERALNCIDESLSS